MKIIEQSVEIMTPLNGVEILKHIEKCGRVCYKSEDKITDESAARFIEGIISRGHEAVLEHYSITVKFITDRGVSHEIVRHRLASYCQESTRYCNYSKDKFGGELTFFYPLDHNGFDSILNKIYQTVEKSYLQMLRDGATPEEARSILPNCLKTELVMTANLREWRHFLKLRTAKTAHPQIRKLAQMLLDAYREKIPVIFDDI